MKKILFFVSALAGLFFAASCQQEKLEPVSGAGTVTYTVQLPDAIGTKAVGDDVSAVTELVYAVYRTEAADKNDFTQEETKLFQKVADIDPVSGQATVSFELVNNQNFRVLFWAQVPGNGVYSTSENPLTADLKNVTLSQSLKANVENYAVFAGSDYIKAGSSLNRTVPLVRPVAQLNIGTTEESLLIENTTPVEIFKSAVEVKGLSTSYNVAQDKAGEIAVTPFVYAAAQPEDLSTDKLTVKVNSNSADYKYISMNYLGFMPVTGANIDVTYTIETRNVGTITNTISNVPVKANYRTNIIGNLITSTSNYTVALDKEWGDEGKNMEVLADGIVKNINGDYEVTTEQGLAYAINNLWNKPEGGNFYLTRDVYEMAGYHINPPTVSGTLHIYGETPIVTRSASTGSSGSIVIKGLDYLIDTIEGNANVTISGITMQEPATLSQPKLVKEVKEGADVVVSDCAASINETEFTSDLNALIGTGADNVLNASEVKTLAELREALASGVKVITVTGNITVNKGETVELDLDGKTVAGVSSTTGKNYNMIDVNGGTLTVKNGTLTAEFKGTNMGWGASTNVFNVTAGGVLNLDNVTVKNLGGSDMAFVAHLNNWGEVTLNVNNSTLESTYIAVRVFNSGNDMNNVTIKNSTLKGKYCFWVHNYTLADFGTQEKVDAHKALLNFDIFNGTNTFEYNNSKNAPVLYGFTDEIYLDENGNEIVADGVIKNTKGEYLISNAAGLKWVADEVNKYSNYEHPFEGKTIKLMNDIDLNGMEWTPIGDYRFSANRFCGTFDGQGYTVSNFKITKNTDKNDSQKSSYGFFGNLEGTLKNLTVKGVTVENVYAYSAALVGRFNAGLIENCHVEDANVSNTYWQGGVLIGQQNNGGTTVKGCTVKNSSVTSKSAIGILCGPVTADGTVAGDIVFENCSVTDCQVIQKGSFGGSYDKYFGSLFGYLEAADNAPIKIVNCTVENTTVKDEPDAPISGDFDGKIYVDGIAVVTTADQLSAALNANENVVLMNDILLDAPLQVTDKIFAIDGNGYRIGQSSAYELAGTSTAALLHPIRCNASIQNVVFDGVKGDGPIRTVDTKLLIDNVTVTNCERTVTGATAQGLFRLHGESTVTNCTFKNNTCPMCVTLNWDGDNELPQAVKNCVFEENDCISTAVVYYVKGSGCVIDGNKFVGNTVTVTGSNNAATLYMGFTENNTVTNNLFQNNTVNVGTSKRVSGGVMLGYETVITGNSFIGNTVNGENAKGNDVCASVYYTDIDLSGNYWGGSAPVADDDYFVEYPDKHKVIINDYLTTNPIQ